LGILGVSIELGSYHGFFEPKNEIMNIIREAWGPVSYLYRLSGPWVNVPEGKSHETAAVDGDYFSDLVITYELANQGLREQGSGKFNLICRHHSGTLRINRLQYSDYAIGDDIPSRFNTA